VKIRTIIADDEELARRGLRALSQRCEDLELICECPNGQQTVDAIRRHRPDLVFLDVQMPGKTGFDVISALADVQRPHVVFVTAYDKFALRAFADSLRLSEPALRVTTVYPGRTDTDMQRELVSFEDGEYDADRFLRADTVAAAVAHAIATPTDGHLHEVILRPRG